MDSLPNSENMSVEGRWNDVGFSDRLFLIFSVLIFVSEKLNTNLHNRQSFKMSLVILYVVSKNLGDMEHYLLCYKRVRIPLGLL